MKKILALSLGIVLMASSIWGATLISLPNTYTTGTKIQAAQVNANEQHIQTIVNGNMPTGTVVGTTDSQTLTNKTLTSPILTTAPSITGDTTFSTGVKAIFGNAARYIKDNTSVYAIEFGTHTVIPATSKLYLDGGSNTYIYETSADVINFVAGGTPAFWVRAGDVIIPTTNKLFLDGGDNTYICNPASDEIRMYCGDVNSLDFTASVFYATGIYAATSANAANVVTLSDGQVLRSTSARKYKTNERPLLYDKTKLMSLKAIVYNSKCKNDDPKKDYIGIVADDAVKFYPELVTYGKDGQIEGFQYERLTAVLLNAIQTQQIQIDALTKRIEKLEAK